MYDNDNVNANDNDNDNDNFIWPYNRYNTNIMCLYTIYKTFQII